MKKKPMRTLLMIAYFFPPLGGIATHRTVKFARYLPQFGWRPVVLTVQGSSNLMRDEELITQVPSEMTVYRASTIEPQHLYNLYRRFVSARWRRPGDKSTKQIKDVFRGSLLARLQSWLFVPDGNIGWLPSAVTLGKRILQIEQPAAIFSTSLPNTAHLIARSLARKSRLPWVMDLRDPWVTNQHYPPPTRGHRALAMWLESGCVNRANRVVSVTPPMTDEIRQRYSDQPVDKFLTITNGFDSADFDPTLTPETDCFSIRHIGTMYAGRSVLPFLRGLMMAIDQDSTLKEVLKVEFIGNMNPLNQQIWDAFVTTHNLQSWVTRQPFMSHQKAVKFMQQSQVVVLIERKGYGLDRVYTGKLFEYLGTGRPILALVPPGIAADLVRELEAGIVVHHDNPKDVAQAILKFYTWFQQGRLQNWSPKNVEVYERRHLTKQLASLLDELLVSG